MTAGIAAAGPETAAVITAIGTAVAALIAALTGTLTVLLTRRSMRLQTEAKDTTTKIHTLVNSSMGAVLRTVSLQAQRLALLSGTPEDLILAKEAQAAFEEHQRKQGVVDLREDMKADIEEMRRLEDPGGG